MELVKKKLLRRKPGYGYEKVLDLMKTITFRLVFFCCTFLTVLFLEGSGFYFFLSSREAETLHSHVNLFITTNSYRN